MVNGFHVGLLFMSSCICIVWDFFKRVFIIILHRSRPVMTKFYPTLRKLKYFGFKIFLSPGKILSEDKTLSQGTPIPILTLPY